MKKKFDFNFIREYLTFSKKEQRGLWVLGLLIFFVLTANGLWPMLYQEEQVDFSVFEKEIQAFEASLANNQIKKKKPVILPDSETEKEVVKKVKPVIVEPIIEKKKIIIELNSCDSAKLVELKGIGPVFASRIIKYRKILGGYYCREQLIEVYGMDSVRLLPILSSIIVDSTLITRMDLNSVEFKKLLRHPYFEYETVKAIFNFKRDNNGFSNISQVMHVGGVSEEMYEKMKNYLVVI